MEKREQGDVAFISGQWPLDREKPTILFIHGAGESSLLWHAQVDGLKARANTVAVDLPGHGRSRGSAKQRVEDYAADLVDFITAIAAPQQGACETNVVITGPSGSGKSSLAFDTIYAEGQRRYIETFSAYARQFLGQMPKPRVEHVSGLSPAMEASRPPRRASSTRNSF